MELGIFAKTFKRPSADETLKAVRKHGFTTVQFNMACAGLESMPIEIPKHTLEEIKASLDSHKLSVCALSATFNAIHPDPRVRLEGIQRFKVLAGVAKEIGTNLLTVCTGSRDPQNKWKHHPDNQTPEAWKDLLATLSELIEVAEEYDLFLGIEPEINNVINSPERAFRLINEMGTQRLRIVMDPSNIFTRKNLSQMDSVLVNAFDLLGSFISLAHAKDVSDEEPPTYGAAGTGVLNYSLYLDLLRKSGYQGPLILHSLSEEQVPASRAYVSSFLS